MMLGNLKDQPADKIIELMALYAADTRADKVDLGVGVYKDASGATPIMRAIKTAEQRLWQNETTKSYTALAGDAGFARAMQNLILGDAVPADRIAAAATPGGTGAVRLGLELVKMASPEARIFVSRPTWPNHLAIVKYLGLPLIEYPYFDEATCTVDFDAMMAGLADLRAGDVVLLHGCCHNPTGANLTLDQWKAVTAHLAQVGATPMIDIAYQGFGDGLEQDAAGLRHLAANLPEVLICASCSKNFGVYRERVGLLMALSAPATKATAQANLVALNRLCYSFPPDHGARLVTMVLDDPALRADWMAELEDVRTAMLGLRQQLADELRQRTNSDRFDFIARHRGMFSRIGASPEEVMKMREDFGIYMVGDSRLNIAGLNDRTVPLLAEAIAQTCR